MRHETEVRALLGRMTLREKIGQLCQYVAPGIDALREGALVEQDASLDTGDNAPHYADLSLGDMLRMIEAGEIGSFLSCYDPGEAELLQERAERSRLGIPLLIGVDAIHGHGMYHGGATVFPSPITLAASFSTDLVRDIARATARETRATGAHWSFLPNVDVTRDPRWGRMGETFGESSALVAELGRATIEGLEGTDLTSSDSVLSCAKHLAAGGTPENGANFAPMDISERTLRETYLEPFRVAVASGCRTVMAAHNEINGVPCHGNTWLLQDVLRDELGFDGLVVSDFTDVVRLHTLHGVAESPRAAYELALASGIDMHMHGPGFFEAILAAVEAGRIAEERVDEAAGRVLAMKFEVGLLPAGGAGAAAEPQAEPGAQGATDPTAAGSPNLALRFPEHDELALRAARESVVLLTNDGTLPLLRRGTRAPDGGAGAPRRVLVTGPNANDQTILGDWSGAQPDGNVTTIAAGLREASLAQETPGIDVIHLPCEHAREITDETIAAAVEAARDADVAVVAVGDNPLRHAGEHRTCGENADRATLDLHGRQNELLQAIAATGTPVVVVIVSGRALVCDWVYEHANAVLYAFEPGARGGTAIAQIATGEVNPSGRLPVTIPRSVGHIPQYHDHPATSYYRGYLDLPDEPWFAFGHGLSYTRFEYSELAVPTRTRPGDDVPLELTVTNAGRDDGDEVILVYLRDVHASVTRPLRSLAAWARVRVGAGEQKRVPVSIPAARFELVNASLRRVVEPGEFEVRVGENVRVVRMEQ